MCHYLFVHWILQNDLTSYIMFHINSFMLHRCVFSLLWEFAWRAILKLACPIHCSCLCVMESSILRDSLPARHACLPTLKPPSCQCVMPNQTKSQLSPTKGRQRTPSPSPARLVSPPTFHPSNKSPFKRTISEPWNLETTSETQQQKCTERLTRRSTHLLVWVSKLTARQEKTAADYTEQGGTNTHIHTQTHH